MGLELDTLKNNGDKVIYNNTSGIVVGGFYDLKSFKDCLFDQWQINEGKIKDYFSFDELQDFFCLNAVTYAEKELKELMGDLE